MGHGSRDDYLWRSRLVLNGDLVINSLEKAQAVLKERREAGIKQVRLNPLQKAKQDPKSFRKAINAKCYDCAYDSEDRGNWIEQVTRCGGTDCPLYPLRPVTKTD